MTVRKRRADWRPNDLATFRRVTAGRPIHPWHDIPTGPKVPDLLTAVIEIPRHERNKYELDKDLGMLRLDRVLYSAVQYPGDYGFLPRTLGDDGDPLDVLVMMTVPVCPLCLVEVRPVGIFHLVDRGASDEKILAVPTHDPFADEISFFLGGMLFEDVGVTGYKGATPLIQDKELQEDIAGVLAVEAYHMGMARSLLFQAGDEAREAANAITEARGELNGMPEIEQGIEVNGHANFVPSDDRGIAFSRTPQQVLQIGYVTPETGVSSSGFFPDGVNGDLAST